MGSSRSRLPAVGSFGKSIYDFFLLRFSLFQFSAMLNREYLIFVACFFISSSVVWHYWRGTSSSFVFFVGAARYGTFVLSNFHPNQ